MVLAGDNVLCLVTHTEKTTPAVSIEKMSDIGLSEWTNNGHDTWLELPPGE